MPPAADPPDGRDERTVIHSRAPRAPGQRGATAAGQRTSAAPGRSGSAWRSAFDARSGRSGGSQLAAGVVLNNTHRVEALVARGGMGEVYRATNLVTGDTVALKTVRPEFAGDPKISELFRREAAALRKVHNPAVVYYEGAFFDDSGQLYLVMEFCDGPSLATAIHSGALRPDQVRALRDRLASGLAAAHAEGVIHRDLSPENVILPGGRLEDAKLIDFGIARQQATEKAKPQHTLIGSDFAGKYAYVSPEQLGLYGGNVDGRSDIYSLGLVLAAMAGGRQLNMGDSPGTAVEARRHVPDLSSVPAELRDELGYLLQPDPAQRPPSMAALAAGGRRGVVRKGRGGGTLRKGAIAAAILAVAVGGGWLAKDMLWPSGQTGGGTQEERDRLERERQVREAQQRLERDRQAREEQQRLERERQARDEQQRLERERQAREEQQRLERERLGRDEQQRLERERQAREEQQRLERERQAREEQQRLERERQQLQVNLGALRTQTLAVVSRQQQCGWLLAEVSDDARVGLDGFVGREADRPQLVGALEQLRGVRAIEDRRVAPSWPICDLLQVLRVPPASEVLLAGPTQVSPIRVSPSQRTYRQGETPGIRVLLDTRAGTLVGVKYARVSVIGADGMVSSPAAWVQEVNEDSRILRFPESGGATLARANGPAIVLALLSQNALFSSPRPASETATQFFFALRLALQANPDTRAAFTIMNFAP